MSRWRFLVCTAAAVMAATSVQAEAQQTSSTEEYTYDSLGRLITVDTTGGQNDDEVHSVCYDSSGNRVEYTATSDGTTATCVNDGSSGSPPPPPPPASAEFAINDASASEGNSVLFSVARTGITSAAHSVDWSLQAQSATAGVDYTTASGTLTFQPGETSLPVSVQTLTDTLVEFTEYFHANLSNPTNGASLMDDQGIGYIVNNGAPQTTPDSASGPCYETLPADLTANDTDPESNYPLTLTAIVKNSGLAGATIVSASSVSVDYAGSGDVSDFTYTVEDSLGNSATGSLSVSTSSCGGGGPPL